MSGQLPHPALLLPPLSDSMLSWPPLPSPQSVHPFLLLLPLRTGRTLFCASRPLDLRRRKQDTLKGHDPSGSHHPCPTKRKTSNRPQSMGILQNPDQHTSEWPRQSKLSQRPIPRGAQEMQRPHMASDLLQEEGCYLTLREALVHNCNSRASNKGCEGQGTQAHHPFLLCFSVGLKCSKKGYSLLITFLSSKMPP